MGIKLQLRRRDYWWAFKKSVAFIVSNPIFCVLALLFQASKFLGLPFLVTAFFYLFGIFGLFLWMICFHIGLGWSTYKSMCADAFALIRHVPRLTWVILVLVTLLIETVPYFIDLAVDSRGEVQPISNPEVALFLIGGFIVLNATVLSSSVYLVCYFLFAWKFVLRSRMSDGIDAFTVFVSMNVKSLLTLVLVLTVIGLLAWTMPWFISVLQAFVGIYLGFLVIRVFRVEGKKKGAKRKKTVLKEASQH